MSTFFVFPSSNYTPETTDIHDGDQRCYHFLDYRGRTGHVCLFEGLLHGLSVSSKDSYAGGLVLSITMLRGDVTFKRQRLLESDSASSRIKSLLVGVDSPVEVL